MNTASPSLDIDAARFDTEVRNSDIPVLVDFWAPWCGPCQTLGPTVAQLARDVAGQARVVKVNIDEHPELAAEFGVQSIPTLVFVENGEERDRVIGLVPGDQLRARLAALID